MCFSVFVIFVQRKIEQNNSFRRKRLEKNPGVRRFLEDRVNLMFWEDEKAKKMLTFLIQKYVDDKS